MDRDLAQQKVTAETASNGSVPNESSAHCLLSFITTSFGHLQALGERHEKQKSFEVQQLAGELFVPICRISMVLAVIGVLDHSEST